MVSLCTPLFATTIFELPAEPNPVIGPVQDEFNWIESKISSMTLEEKIGQLMMVAAYSGKDKAHENEIASLVKNYQLGGLIFFKGGPVKQAKQTNRYQKEAKVPLMIAIDGEWGLSMRLDSTVKYPRQLMLGALQDNQLIYNMGRQIAQQCKRIGVHVNFAPVIDVNNNANNPVINDRSFGEDKYNVAAKGMAYMKGMQDNGVMACAKHFPGHGDTNVDSHLDLPVIQHDRARLEDLELFPFKELIRNDLQSMMIAHLSIPALDPTPNQASTLSKPIVTDLLRHQMGFDGLIFTDALNMEGVAKYYGPGEVEVKALQAGNDVLLFPRDVRAAVKAITNAINNGTLSVSRIEESVRRILKAKYKVGLNRYQPVNTQNIINDLNQVAYDLLNRQINENAQTLVENQHNLVPLKRLDTLRIASVTIGGKPKNFFTKTLDFYAPVDDYYLSKSASETDKQNLLNALKPYNLVITSIHDMSRFKRKNYFVTNSMQDIVQRIEQSKKQILIVNGTPYSLEKFNGMSTLMCTYQDTELSQQVTAQILFGAIGANGALPVTANSQYYYGKTFKTPGGLRLKYTVPEEVGLSRYDFLPIDSIAQKAIDSKATPGCVVLMAKDGKVIFYKSYGYHTYNKKTSVHPGDIYDIASLTKVCATNLSLMKLHEEQRINIDGQLGSYCTRVKGSNKENIVISDMLLHEAGLVSWIPFYAETVDDKKNPGTQYSTKKDGSFNLEVANGLYMDRNYVGEMWDTILSSELLNLGKYRYSDLGYYLFKETVEEQTQLSFDVFTDQKFYRPLGLKTMTFNPLLKHDTKWIVPTEKDDYFRHQTLDGHVHDMGAAMLGGVSGHAGLFSNANDLAIVFQMLLNKGNYGGEYYFSPETIDRFTAIQKENNRRGLGFDKPNLKDIENSPCCEDATSYTFGHTGFTGTCAWADPTYNTVYVFLSNRVHPKMNNTKLLKDDVRTKIQQVMYDALERAGLK